MSQPTLELADIFRQYGPAYRQAHSLPLHQRRLMQAIETCRTPALGGVVEWCDHCQYTHTRYRSCRNRHCPKCQGLARAQWIPRRKAELLPTEYFHVVFTLPLPIAAIAFYNREAVYELLFRIAAQTLLTIAADPQRLGVELGFFCVLHTWGQNLHFHPHLHCVVPGGGLSPDHDRWIHGRRKYLLPAKVLSRRFRRLFPTALEKAYAAGKFQFFGDLQPLRDPQAFANYLGPLRKREWVVYAKAPFGGPQHVLDYLGRYTHRVAISNRRLLALENGEVSLAWKDYRDAGQDKVMTSRPRISFAASSNTHFRRASNASAITAFWPTAIAHASSNSAGNCWPRRAPLYCRAWAIAASSFRRLPTRSSGAARSAASAFWRASRSCRRAEWTPHEGP